MKPRIFEVTQIGSGKLCVMPKPDSQYLGDAVNFFHYLGINTIVCLLEMAEIEEYGLQQEEALCQQTGMDFVHFPIADSHIPANAEAFRGLVNALHGKLQDGQNIVIHCRAGIGRTGVLAGCILVNDGMAGDDAIQQISGARGFPIPETEAQYDYILDFVG